MAPSSILKKVIGAVVVPVAFGSVRDAVAQTTVVRDSFNQEGAQLSQHSPEINAGSGWTTSGDTYPDLSRTPTTRCCTTATANLAAWNNNTNTLMYSRDNHLETWIIGPTTTNFVYEADSWREKMTTSGTTSCFLRGANGELLTESRNPGGASPSMRDYIYAGTRPLSVVTVDGTAH
jgi:hypothetical protein